MTEIVFDIETDGLNPTRIWCVVAQVVGAGEHVFLEHERALFKQFLEEHKGATLYAHNGIGFDYPVLSRLWGIIPVDGTTVWRDTYVLSSLSNPSRLGGHSLGNWGDYLGFPKGGHEDWSQYSEEMLTYCKRDVQVTCKVLETLHKELEGFDEESINLEHSTAWIIKQQERNGWLLDMSYAMQLFAQMKERQNELEETVQRVFTPLPTFIKSIAPKIKKDGTMSIVGLKFLGDRWGEVAGDFSRIDWPVFNLGSRQQIARHLQYYGWKPTKLTAPTEKGGGGNIMVDEKVLEGVEGIPEATLIREYLTMQKLSAMVGAWIDHADQDTHRIHGRVRSNGAVTGRMTHSDPNLAQVPAKSEWGPKCRRCFIVEQGYKLVGTDASGLELRMLAHYMDDDAYTKEVLDGDVHTANQRAAGLDTRDLAKTFIYAFLYGAGDPKIGSIVGGSAKAGKALKAKFLKNTPALESLRERVLDAAERGWLRGLDGRRIAVRSSHAALNTLLQGAGAVIMKRALCILDEYAKLWSITYRFVGNIHDEIQAEVLEKDAKKFAYLAEASLVAAGQYYNLRCPLAGEAKIGLSWEETH